ncbi:hypothetical protein [Sporosarcina sp. ZBG7A]|uniref:hypothetical protein n=1 Tax=Sporosarcina sp. ZBG7A TaxID=1582223 RepID=UPI0012E04871|nr:hypothetical protein [Sporosarcina sp. ZBG7A]
MERGIGTFERRIGNSKELIGNETQFNTVKGLIGSAELVSRWAKTRAEGIGNMSGDIGSFKR